MAALLGQPAMLHEATFCPESRSLQGSLLITPSVMKGGALVEGEDDVSAQLVLNLHGHLRGKAVHGSIEMRFKGNPIVIYMGEPFLIICNYLI